MRRLLNPPLSGLWNHVIHLQIGKYTRDSCSCGKSFGKYGFILSEHRFSTLAMQIYYVLPQAVRVFIMKRLFGNPWPSPSTRSTVRQRGGSCRTLWRGSRKAHDERPEPRSQLFSCVDPDSAAILSP